jgi:hypothetical protein
LILLSKIIPYFKRLLNPLVRRRLAGCDSFHFPFLGRKYSKQKNSEKQ